MNIPTVNRTALASGGAIITVVTLGHFINDGFASLLTPLLPQIREQYSIDIGQTALLVAIMSLVGSVFQPVWGMVGDRVDLRFLAAIGPVLTSLGMVFIGYAPNFWLLGVLVAIAGIGSAIFHPNAASYVAANSSLEKRGLFASLFSAGGTAGLALGPVAAQLIGIRGLVWLLPIGLVMGATSDLVTPATRRAAGPTKGLAEYRETFNGPIRALWGMSVLRSLSTVSYASLIGFQLKAQGLEVHIGWTLATFNLASSIGGIIGGQLSDRLGRTRVLRSSVFGLIPLFVALVYSSPTNWWFYPLCFLVGGIANATIPVAVVAAQEFAPNNVSTASAMMMGFSWGTAGVLFLAVGKLADFTGPIPAMLFSIAMLIPSVWLVLKLPEPPRTKIG